jgi:hypothetical protein
MYFVGGSKRSSGGGNRVVQLLIEDVGGTPFADSTRHARQQCSGMVGYDWAWASELCAGAATPDGFTTVDCRTSVVRCR